MTKTELQYWDVIKECKSLYEKKQTDYGAAWRILRSSSLTDQIFIKAQRVRTIQIKGTKKVNESEKSEFIGILNYSIMALVQLELGHSDSIDFSAKEAVEWYEKKAQLAFELMQNKNHDYGEAWRDMRVSSITDLILQKVQRIKQIEDNQGITVVSEGLDANYLDMINYAIFALILIAEQQ